MPVFGPAQVRIFLIFSEDEYSPLRVVTQSEAGMDEVELTLRHAMRPFPSLQLVRNSVYLRVAHRAYSKGTALAEIQRILQVAPDQTVAAGDHFNDLPMLDRTYARYLISPQNSVAPVRARVREQGGYLATRKAGLGILEGLLALGI